MIDSTIPQSSSASDAAAIRKKFVELVIEIQRQLGERVVDLTRLSGDVFIHVLPATPFPHLYDGADSYDIQLELVAQKNAVSVNMSCHYGKFHSGINLDGDLEKEVASLLYQLDPQQEDSAEDESSQEKTVDKPRG